MSPPTPLVLSHVLQWAQKDLGLSLTSGVAADTPPSVGRAALLESLSRITNCCSRLSSNLDISLRRTRQLAKDGLHDPGMDEEDGDDDDSCNGSPLARLQAFLTTVSSLLLLTLAVTPSKCMRAMKLTAKRSTGGVGDGTGSSSSAARGVGFDGTAPIHAGVLAASPDKVASSLFRVAVASVAQAAGAWPHALNVTSQMLVCNQPFAPKWIPDEQRGGCANCSKPFSVTLRRHHCRACGDLFCKPCWYGTLAFALCCIAVHGSCPLSDAFSIAY